MRVDYVSQGGCVKKWCMLSTGKCMSTTYNNVDGFWRRHLKGSELASDSGDADA